MCITFQDRFLPSQPVHKNDYLGHQDLLLNRMYETIQRVSNLQTPDQKFELSQSNLHSQEEMGSSPLILQFLQSQVLIRQPLKVLEIGTFIGVASMYMAEVLPPEGRITTIEKFDHFAKIANDNFEQNLLSHKIHLINNDALEELSNYSNQNFDFIYLDGNKENYKDYFFILDKLLVPEGILIVDDVFFHGDVFNEISQSEKGKGVHEFLDYIAEVKTYHKTLLPLGNGLLTMIKKRNVETENESI